MTELFTRIITIFENYYLANYLIAGCAIWLGIRILDIYALSDSWYTILIAYYFSGMVASRLSSVVIEPIFKKLKIVEKAPYRDFMNAEKADNSGKLLELSKVNSIYRSMCGVALLLFVASLIHYWPFPWHGPEVLIPILASLALLILFVLSFRKQTEYIKKRVNHINSRNV